MRLDKQNGVDNEFQLQPTGPSSESIDKTKLSVNRVLEPQKYASHFLKHSLPFGKLDNSNFSETRVVDYMQEAVFFSKVHEILPEDHPNVQALQEDLNELLEATNLPQSNLKVLVYNSTLPDVHVNVVAREVRVSSTFIELMDYRRDLIMATMAHELGHVLLQHREDKVDDLQQYEVFSDAGIDMSILSDLTRSYEEEYQADRASVILMYRCGLNPSLLSDCLQKIKNFSVIEKNQCGAESYSIDAWFLSTHPYIPRRQRSIKILSRTLGKNGSSKTKGKLQIPNFEDFNESELETFDAIKDYDDHQYFDSLLILGGLELEKFDKKIPKVDIDLKKFSDFVDTSGKDFDFLEFTPDEVNFWKEDDEEIEEWWRTAVNTVLDVEGLEDLMCDLESYSLDAIKILLKNFPLIKFFDENVSDRLEYDY
ncbi:M48 family metalloprotease, partial [Candidatus Peregrinibacteria bacterium]|nr:M48 family metalloprotease [Candidatus Peregrinibacteria bacterium]